MFKGLRTCLSALLCLSFLTFASPLLPAANAAACTVLNGTVSGTTRYTIVNAGSGCTWSVPAGVTNITYLAVGGGGGGGGARPAALSPNLGGGGGGAGGIVQASSFITTGGTTITLTIGAGGGGGAAGVAGGNGSATTFTYSSTTITANGGYGGGGSNGTSDAANLSGDGGSNSSFTGGYNNWDGGGGGAGSNAIGSDGADIAGQGGIGGNGGAATASTLLGGNSYYGGGGGGGGTPSTNSNESDGYGGSGGNSVGGNGGGGPGIAPLAGAANSGSGGGGGGWRYTSSDAQRAGAAGADGKIIFVYTKNAGTLNSISITSSSGADNTYSLANVITVTIVASEAITVTGSPRIPVLGLTGKYFAYSSGSGTSSLLFNYTVVTGDSATAGVGVTANSLDLNSGSFVDTAGLGVATSHSAIAQALNQKVDGILPSLVGVTQSFSVPENETRTTILTTSESATFAFAGIYDNAFFILDTVTGTLTLTPRDFENKLDGDANNVYYIGILLKDFAGNQTGSLNFNVTITDVAESAAISTPTLGATAKKGVSVTITVTSDVAGKVDFYWNGKRIPGCLSRPTSGTAPNMTATCSWKPTTAAPSSITATIKPTSGSYSAKTSPALTILPAARGTYR